MGTLLRVAAFASVAAVLHIISEVQKANLAHARKLQRMASEIWPDSNRKKPKAPSFKEVDANTGITLSRYMMEFSRENPDMRDLESLMNGIQQASRAQASRYLDRT